MLLMFVFQETKDGLTGEFVSLLYICGNLRKQTQWEQTLYLVQCYHQ